MKLTELATPKKSRQVAKVFESYFGTKMPVNRLTLREAQAMLKRVRGVIAVNGTTSAGGPGVSGDKNLI